MNTDRETIDFREVAQVVRGGWRWIGAGVLLGLVLALAIIATVTPRYQSRALVLLRSGPEDAGSSLSGIARNAQGGGLSLGGLASVLTLASGFETEIEVLTSRSVIEAVVDSLGLQAEVLRPRGVDPRALFSTASWDPSLMRPVTYRFRREAGGYRVTGPGAEGMVAPGEPYRVGGSEFTLAGDGLPSSFTVRVIDRQEAIRRTERRLRARRAGGDVAEITYRGQDRVVVADVPNALISKYLERRRTTDRGVNQRRYEFLAAHTDSVRGQLALAEHTLRSEQERTGVFDPEVYGKAEIEHGLLLRAELQAAEVEARSLRDVLARAQAGAISASELASYPTFLVNPGMNEIVGRLTTLEAERTQLLDRRTERDSDVQTLDRQIEQLEGRLVAMSRAYLEGLRGKEAEIRRELSRYSAVLATLPEHAETNYRAQREVRRLSETLVALESELVQARLAALAEGGDVRPVDLAVPPNRPSFPQPALTLVFGLFGGLFLGVVGALTSGYMGNRVREPFQVELATGVPVVRFDATAPLLLQLDGNPQTLLLVPVGGREGVGEIARRIAATASLRGTTAVVAEFDDPPRLPPGEHSAERDSSAALSAPASDTALATVPVEDSGTGGAFFVYRNRMNGTTNRGVAAVVDELEARFSFVVAALPSLSAPVTAALLREDRSVVLVASSGSTRRDELALATDTLDRIGVAPVGVILRDGAGGSRST